MNVDDILAEAKRTPTVEAALKYVLLECRNAMNSAGVNNPGLHGTDQDSLLTVHALFSRADEVVAAIIHGTPTAKDDADANAPPRGFNAGSTGNEVYGTLDNGAVVTGGQQTGSTDAPAASQGNQQDTGTPRSPSQNSQQPARTDSDTPPGQSAAAQVAQPKEQDNQAKASGEGSAAGARSVDGVSSEVPK